MSRGRLPGGTHLKLDSANRRKLDALDQVAEAYLALVQVYINHIFEHNLREAKKLGKDQLEATAELAQERGCDQGAERVLQLGCGERAISDL